MRPIFSNHTTIKTKRFHQLLKYIMGRDTKNKKVQLFDLPSIFSELNQHQICGSELNIWLTQLINFSFFKNNLTHAQKRECQANVKNKKKKKNKMSELEKKLAELREEEQRQQFWLFLDLLSIAGGKREKNETIMSVAPLPHATSVVVGERRRNVVSEK